MQVDCIGEWAEEFEMGALSWWMGVDGCGKGVVSNRKEAKEYG